MSTEPVSDERLRQAVRDVLAEELDQSDGDQPNATRRQVLGSIAAGGVLGGLAGAGSAAGATGGENTSGMVGALAGPPYKVADPGLYSGPDSSKGTISHSVGQVHLAQDTGARYYDDGSKWDLLPLQTQRVNNEVYAGQFDGAGLASKVEAALDWLETNVDGRGRVRITAPNDGGTWSWDKELVIDRSTYADGFDIEIDKPVEIEYGGSGTAITIDDYRDTQPAYLRGGIWTATGTPTSAFDIVDSIGAVVQPAGATGWTNGSVDATICRFRNVDRFTESSHFSSPGNGRLIGDRIVDFEGATQTGGGGTDSFQGCWTGPGNAKANDFGLRTRGSQSAVEHAGWTFNAGADGFDGVFLDHDNQHPIIRHLEVEDNATFTNTSGFNQGPNYNAGFPPLLLQPTFVGIDINYDMNAGGPFADVSARSKGIRIAGTEGTISAEMQADLPEWYIETSSTKRLSIQGAGVEFARYNAQNLSGVTGGDVGEVRMDDGTNTSSGDPSLCVWNGSAWRIMSEDTTFT